MAKLGDWVEIEDVVLEAGSRAPGVPADTAEVPLTLRTKGRLLGSAAVTLGGRVTVVTPAGRVARGTLLQREPSPPPGFGAFVPELATAAETFRDALRGANAGGSGGGATDRRARHPLDAGAWGGPAAYSQIMGRKNEIMKRSVGIDYAQFEYGRIEFDYEAMMAQAGAELEEVERIQREGGVGGSPLLELHNLTELARRYAPRGKGARILLKDEASNPSGSFKARRAALAVHRARENGFKGVIAATSGNYGAAVASQAAIRGLGCIVVQECFDSRGVGQPEIVEKARACEAYGAEVMQLSVGPELFFVFLSLLEETGWFNASLYTPFGIAGVETLGAEIARESLERYGENPEVVVATHAGGGNVTGTARGLRKAGARKTQVVGASVNLAGLHMASDREFNRKSFTTGHTGFGVPFAVMPDRSDVPRSAARPLRYLDRYVTVQQGEVFAITEALARLEGLERGPAGNTSLAAAFAIARELDRDQILVVQESEYSGAGKHVQAQLSFARENGIEVRTGDPREEQPGTSIVLPESPELIAVQEQDLTRLRLSRIRHALAGHEVWLSEAWPRNAMSGEARLNEAGPPDDATRSVLRFLADETQTDEAFVAAELTRWVNELPEERA